MSNIKKTMTILMTLCAFLCATPVMAQDQELTDVEFYGYKVTHHMGAIVQHMDKFGFNTFDHPPMPDHRFFVITPALDHFDSKAVIDTRWGPVIVDTPARDDRYASLLVTDMEHFGIYAELTDPKGERFVVIPRRRINNIVSIIEKRRKSYTPNVKVDGNRIFDFPYSQ